MIEPSKAVGRVAGRIYLAGPGVFRKDAQTFGRHLRDICAAHGLIGHFPLDQEVRPASPLQMAGAIYRANRSLIDACDAIVAEISPFRGPNMDPGTAWELGYGAAKGLPIVCWSTNSDLLRARTEAHFGLEPSNAPPVDPTGLGIEDFGLAENLMIACSCASIHPDPDAAISACASILRQR
jgi:nucleoside 2-deoxyribosyltransferase